MWQIAESWWRSAIISRCEFRRELGIGLAGLIGGGDEESFAQQRIAGFGQSVLVMCLAGLAEFGDEARVGPDGGQGW